MGGNRAVALAVVRIRGGLVVGLAVFGFLVLIVAFQLVHKLLYSFPEVAKKSKKLVWGL